MCEPAYQETIKKHAFFGQKYPLLAPKSSKRQLTIGIVCPKSLIQCEFADFWKIIVKFKKCMVSICTACIMGSVKRISNTYLINKEISKRNTGMCSGVIETRFTLIPIDR